MIMIDATKKIQVSIQAFMATARFVAIFAIVFGSLCALFLDDSYSERVHPPFFASADSDNDNMSYTACFSGFGVAFSASLFSQLFQHSIPGLLRPLKAQPDKLPAVPVRELSFLVVQFLSSIGAHPPPPPFHIRGAT
jgi:hypothetical protein